MVKFREPFMKKVKRPSKARSPRTTTQQPAEQEAVIQPLPKWKTPPLKWLFAGGLVLVLFLRYLFTLSPNSSSTIANMVAAAVPHSGLSWGTELPKLEIVDKFSAPQDALNMIVDNEGNIFILGEATLYRISRGKKVKSIALKSSAPHRGMAFDGKYFYITHCQNNSVIRIDKNLSKISSFDISGPPFLLGIDWSRHDGLVFATDRAGKRIYMFDSEGHQRGDILGPTPPSEEEGWACDLRLDGKGQIYEINLAKREISFMSTKHELIKTLTSPWEVAAGARQRLAILGDKIYINCLPDQRVFVMDLTGKSIGYIKDDAPIMIAAGQDGFLYLKRGDYVFKMKPMADKKAAVQSNPLPGKESAAKAS